MLFSQLLYALFRSDVRTRMEAMRSYDDLSDEVLNVKVMGIRAASMNDSVSESPHAEFTSLHQHSNASTCAYKAASQRLDQNVRDCERLPSALDTLDLQDVHDNYKQVLQTRQRRRPVRMSRKEFESKLYKCNEVFKPVVPAGIVDALG